MSKDKEKEIEGSQQAEEKLSDDQIRIQELEKQLFETRGKLDKVTRYAAEMDNARKRALVQSENEVRLTREKVIGDILPALDDFERALASAKSDENRDYDKMVEGIELISKNLYRTLEDRYMLKRMDPEGKPFDPVFHEAMLMETSGDVDEDTVSQSLITGYMLGDRVLRTAKVKVVKPEN